MTRRPRTASRFDGIGRSATIALLDRVQELRARGVQVINLAGGEPDADTPRHISEAAVDALRSGFTHYTASRGLPRLREVIADRLRTANGITVDPGTGVIVTPSAKHALFVALTALLDPGDELLVPTPGWVSYTAMASLLGARPVEVPLDPATGFRLTEEALERAVTDRTRAVVINTPNNPTGRVLTVPEIRALGRVADRHGLTVVCDEIYERIVYDGREHVSPAASEGYAERTVTVNGFSKAYAMTGWRLGWVAGPSDLLAQMVKVQEHTVGCASSFAQLGGLAALEGPQEPVAAMVAEYDVRRRLVTQGLNRLPGVRCAPIEGAFYAFADVSAAPGGEQGAADFCERVLMSTGVALTPGPAFGSGLDGYVRLSFAASRPELIEALDRLSRALPAGPPRSAARTAG